MHFIISLMLDYVDSRDSYKGRLKPLKTNDVEALTDTWTDLTEVLIWSCRKRPLTLREKNMLELKANQLES